MPDTTSLAHDTRNEPTGAAAAAIYQDRVKELVAAANEWGKLPAITDAEQAGRCDDLIAQCRNEAKAIDDARKRERQPHDEAVRAIQGAFNPLIEMLGTAGAILRKLKAAWLLRLEAAQAEQRRKAEAAALAAQEAADMAAASAAAGLRPAVEGKVEAETAAERARDAAEHADRLARARPQVTSELTGRASGFTKTWAAKITDPVQAAQHYAQHAKVLDAIQQCANADARTMKTAFKVPGCELVEGRRV